MHDQVIDMRCTCDRCIENGKNPDNVVTETIRCDECLGEWPALNLVNDIWPMLLECPVCERTTWYSFPDEN